MKKFLEDKFVNNLIFMTLILFVIEMMFKLLNNFNLFTWSSLRILLSSALISLLVTFISSLFKKKCIRNTINLTFIFIYSLYTWLQLGFINFLGVYISFNTSSQFGAVTNYIIDYLTTFKWTYHLIYIPFILSILYYIHLKNETYIK